jgi:hypothetical protein
VSDRWSQNILSMRGTVHPLVHHLLGKRLGALSKPVLTVEILTDAAYKPPMHLGHPILGCRSVRIDVFEKVAPEHVGVVGTGHARECGVPPEGRKGALPAHLVGVADDMPAHGSKRVEGNGGARVGFGTEKFVWQGRGGRES